MPIEKSVSEERGNLKSNDLTSENIVLKEDELLKMAQINEASKNQGRFGTRSTEN